MKFSNLTVILIFTLSIISCNKEEEQNLTKNQDSTSEQNLTERHDCTFVQNDEDMDGMIDENERAIMTACQESAFTSKTEIENNLIGEWKLIGHGEGWVPSISQPCGYITFSSEALVFEFTNAYIDTVATLAWEIEAVESTIGTYFRLNINPTVLYGSFKGLFINQFSADHMYGDGTPSDGNMHLYEKIN